MAEAIGLDLERLQALPLDLPARITLWRELRAQRRHASQATAGDRASETRTAADTPTTGGTTCGNSAASDTLDDTLRRLLLSDQLSRCRELALQGHWREASQRLASLRDEAEALRLTDVLAQLLQELLEPLQRLLIESADGLAADQQLHSDERAELLWQAHTWQQLLCERRLTGHAALAALAEPTVRLGAVAWLERFQTAREPAERLRALIRSQALLIALAQLHQPCPDWVELALRDGLRTGLIWLGRGLPPAELLRWSQALIESVLPEPQRQAAQSLLWPAEAALEVGQALRLEPFSLR